jgi:hypothetical protein
VTAAPAGAEQQQSLGAVAKKEAERRATAKKAVRSFSNADLSPAEISNPSAPPAAAPADAAAAPEAESNPAAADAAMQNEQPAPEPKEAEWRANAEAIRGRLAKAHAELATVSAAANDPNKTPGERTATARLVDLQMSTIEGLERRWQRLEKRAADAKVPAVWLDPRPVIVPRTQR